MFYVVLNTVWFTLPRMSPRMLPRPLLTFIVTSEPVIIEGWKIVQPIGDHLPRISRVRAMVRSVGANLTTRSQKPQIGFEVRPKHQIEFQPDRRERFIKPVTLC